MFFSRLNAYSSTLMMDTNAHLGFQQELRSQWITAQATGQMQALNQVMTAQGGGGGLASQWGKQAVNWWWFSGLLHHYSPFMIVLGGALAMATYGLKWSQGVMFASLFLVFFFVLHFISYTTYSQANNVATGMTFYISLGVAIVGAFIVSFMVYKPYEVQKHDPVAIADTKTTQPDAPAITYR